MKEYIEREAIDKLANEIKTNFAPLHRHVIDAFIYAIVDKVPAADVAPVVHGEWIERSDKGILNMRCPYMCSICGRVEELKEPYCNCGARMDGGNSNV